ncbi:MAG: site-specific integrase [Pseudodesulfovibrio sp.]|nr:site-specific integrase [Pseudodesulfovibrio sp.]
MAYQRGRSKLWYVSVREPETGRSLRLSAKTEAEAEALALEYRAAKKRGDKSILPIIASKSDTFRDHAIRYLQTLKPDTKKNELYAINTYLHVIGHLPLNRLLSIHLQDVVDTLRERGLAQNSIKRRMVTVKAILNRAAADGIIDSVPSYTVSAGKDAVIIPPSKDEIRRLIANAAPHLIRAIIIDAHTGIRAGKTELQAITWDHIDLNSRVIRVESAKKGGLPWREIPISDTLLPHLQHWHREDGGTGHVVHYKGKQVGSMKGAWASAKRRSGITRRLRMYDMRHAFITEIISSGVDITTAAYLAGHASPATTAKVYRHVKTSDTRAAVEKIGGHNGVHKCPETGLDGHKFSQ